MTGFVIAGLGVTAQGRDLGIPALGLRREALELAPAGAGLRRADVDGCSTSRSGTPAGAAS